MLFKARIQGEECICFDQYLRGGDTFVAPMKSWMFSGEVPNLAPT